MTSSLVDTLPDTTATRPKILFVLTKWAGGNPDHGLSAYEESYWQSLQTCDLADIALFHPDEYYLTHHKTRAEQALIDKCIEEKPDLIFTIMLAGDYYAFCNPTDKALEIIRDQLKIPVVVTFGDFQVPFVLDFAHQLEPYVHAIIGTGSTSPIIKVAKPHKFLYSWVPKDARYFYNPGYERDIPITFSGSRKPRPDRVKRFEALEAAGIDVLLTGGEYEVHLSTEEYANVYQRAKIALSFCHSFRHYFVTNARTFEVTLCGAMLLEEEGYETAKLFTPYEDYVPFTTNKDLIDKIRYYLAHEDERERIATNGCNKSQQWYTARQFWELVIRRGLEKKNALQAEHPVSVLPSPLTPLNDIEGRPPLELSFNRLQCLGRGKVLLFRLYDMYYSSPSRYKLHCFVMGHYRTARKWVDVMVQALKNNKFIGFFFTLPSLYRVIREKCYIRYHKLVRPDKMKARFERLKGLFPQS